MTERLTTTTPVRQKLSSSSFFFFLSFFFFAQHEACGILVNRPRMEPMTPAVEVWSPNHWTTGEIPIKRFLMYPLPFIYRNVRVITQPCLTLCDPMDCSLPGYSSHRILVEVQSPNHWTWVEFLIQQLQMNPLL